MVWFKGIDGRYININQMMFLRVVQTNSNWYVVGSGADNNLSGPHVSQSDAQDVLDKMMDVLGSIDPSTL